MAESDPEILEHEESEDLSDDDFGLDPLYTPEQIQRIQDEAIQADAVAASQQPDAVPEAAVQDAVAEEGSKKRKDREKMTSKWWAHFEKGKKRPDKSYDAICNYYKAKFPMGQGRGTSSLSNHILKSCRKIPREKRHKPDPLHNLSTVSNNKGKGKVEIWVFCQERARKTFAKMVIVHEYTFNIVTHHYFRQFLKDINPDFKLMSKNTVRADCKNIYEEEQKILYDLLGKVDCRVSFTSDLWTNSAGDRGFMSLTAYYIDNSWKIQKRIISFCSLPSPHTGHHIAQALLNKLVEWNLDKRVMCIVLDNASLNDVCIKSLLEKDEFKDSLPASGNILHQRCGCHILNLIVQDGLGVLKGEISNIRDTMKYIKHSQARMERFRKACEQVKTPKDKKPKWDVPTRWNSTYLMLELALELKNAIIKYAILDDKFLLCPSQLDWDNLAALMPHLKVFYTATLKLSGTKYPTLNLYFPEFYEVYFTIKKMEKSPFPFVVRMGKEMFLKWDKYWSVGNALIALACVLDPRCKLEVVEYYYKLIDPVGCKTFITKVRVCLESLFKEYLEEHSNSVQDYSAARRRHVSKTVRALQSAADISEIRAGLKDHLKEKKSNETPKKDELEEYLTDPLDDAPMDEEFDILSWWKMKAPKYPVLSKLTRDILAVPISTIASEACFSTANRTLSVVRNSLKDDILEALICAQDWLKCEIEEDGADVGQSLMSLWSSIENDANANAC